MKTPKVIVIGVDGGTFDYIFPLLKKGSLPNISKLLNNGSWDYLESTIQPITGSAWPSFMTGKMPAKHGVFDFLQNRFKEKIELVNSQSIDGETIFDILSRHKKKVISINVPVTYPPWPINGIMITGMMSPENAEITYPKEFQKELENYRIDFRVAYKEGNEKIFLDDVNDLLERRIEYTNKILQEHEWDFAAVVLRGVDVVSHYFRKHMDDKHPDYAASNNRFRDAIWDIYRRTDSAIGRILKALPEDTAVFIISDHGHGRLRKVVNLNIWFLRNGILSLKKNPWIQLRYLLFRLGFSPYKVYEMLSRIGWQNVIQRVSRQRRNVILNAMLSFSDVNWQRTKAYSLGCLGQIYINLKGREKHGIVNKGEEYERVREEVIKNLKRLKDPETGEFVIESVQKKEALYQGPHLADAPDLFVFSKRSEYDFFSLMAQNTDVFCTHFKKQSGCHRLHGILVAHGPNIDTDTRLKGSRIVDIVPTVLYLLGVPIPDDIDGVVLKGLIRKEFLERNTIEFEQPRRIKREKSAKEAEQEEIRERLKNLGYLG